MDIGALARFRAKYVVRDMGFDTPCWVWTACRYRNGYAKLRLGRRGTPMALSHRLSYEHFVGSIPPGVVLDHLCRVRSCVNPVHLEPVTQRENCLRGVAGATAAARQHAKTHCPHGHPYDAANTYLWRGIRNCRACRVARKRARREALRASA